MLSSSCRNFRQTILGHITDHIRLFICLGDTRSHNSSVAEEEYNPSAVSDEEEHNLSSPAFCIIKTMTDKLDGNERSLYRQGMAAFGGVASTYQLPPSIPMQK